jgi:AcrR family transcriptional regulator
MSKENIPRRGRPRTRGLDEAILEAALDELSRVGYARMTVDAVARGARTTRPTVYARFPTKAALATAALASLRTRTPRTTTGDLRTDLIEELTLFQSGALRPHGMSMIGAVLAEEHETPLLLELFRRNVVAPRRATIRRILRGGRRTGQIRANADIETAITMLIGSLYASFLAGRTIPPDWPQRVVDAWLDNNRA